jgi:type IV pilus assembly protein PilY1
MNKFYLVWATLFSAIPYCAFADDLDVYLQNTPMSSPPYLHVLLDYRASGSDHLCTYGVSCKIVQADGTCPVGVCFSPRSHSQLLAPLSPAKGDSISKWDSLMAIYSAALIDREFADLSVAVLVSNSGNGGTLLQGYKRLGAFYDPSDPSDAEVPATTKGAITGAQKLVKTLRSIPPPIPGARDHDFQPKESYLEWFRYLNGGAVLHGTNTSTNFNSAVGGKVVPNFDASIVGPKNAKYASPFQNSGACSKMFSIMSSLGTAHNDDDLDHIISNKLYSGLNISTQRKLSLSEFLKRIHADDMDLVGDSLLGGINPLEKTWIITDSSSLLGAKQLALAGNSGSPWPIENPSLLERRLRNAMRQMISSGAAVITAFAPVSALGRAQFSDNLFVSLFKAKETSAWVGNIKKLKLLDTDANGVFDEVIDASRPSPKEGFELSGARKGRINFGALTFWTDASALPSIAGTYAPRHADGAVVARGGSGQKIDGFLTSTLFAIGDTNVAPAGVRHRQVFLEPAIYSNGISKTLEDFDVNAATLGLSGLKAMLGNAAMSNAEALDLIRWGRGQDVNNARAAARTWISAESPHSNPLVINYGAVGGYSSLNPNIRLFLGSGDGLFRGIENTSTSGAESGREVFGFYPRELLKNLAVRKSDSRSSLKMNYGIDGAPAALIVDNNQDGNLVSTGQAPLGGDEVYIYFGLRRGGNSYYALDVSDPSKPPKIKWKITRTIAGDFDELGLSFSEPIVGKVEFNGSPLDVVIFAGGYHGGWDKTGSNRIGKDLDSSPDAGFGNAIYIVDARTGSLVWKAIHGAGNATAKVYQHPDLEDGIPSTVSALRNSAGVMHRLYVGDTGGALWRVDIPQMSADQRVSKWFMTKLAELGNDGSTAASDRRFFHAPDLLTSFDSQGSFDGIVISSGDRAHPNETKVANYHFYIKDRYVRSGDLAMKSRAAIPFASALPTENLFDQSLCLNGTEMSCASTLSVGWKVKMPGQGEKGLGTPHVADGKVFFSSFQPAPQSSKCTLDPGQGSVSIVNLADGTAAYTSRTFAVGPGIPPQLVSAGGTLLAPGSGVNATNPGDPNDVPCKGKLCTNAANLLQRVYWRQPGSDNL